MNTATRPAWLTAAQEHYTDTAARELIAAAWELASRTPTPPDERSQMLLDLLLDLRGDASLLAAGLLVAPWREKHLDAEALAESPCKAVTPLLQALDDLSSTTCTSRSKATLSACAKCCWRWRAICAPSSSNWRCKSC